MHNYSFGTHKGPQVHARREKRCLKDGSLFSIIYGNREQKDKWSGDNCAYDVSNCMRLNHFRKVHHGVEESVKFQEQFTENV